MPPPFPAGSPAYYRLAIILGTLSAMGPLAIDMYLPSFPSIARELGATSAAMEVTAAVYFVGLAVGQGIYGPITDRVGRKRPLYVGLVVFLLASIGCTYASSVPALIVLRILQALGGCAEIVVARAMIRDCFDERDSVRILSLILLVMGVAPILAPLIGGQLLVHFGWRAVFWTLAGYAGTCLVAVYTMLPESLPVEQRRNLSLAEVGSVYAQLLRDRGYMAMVLAGSFTIAAMFAYISGSPHVFIEIFDVPPDRFGLFFGSNALGLIVASQINGRLARRVPAHAILGVILPITAAASLVLLTNAITGFGGFPGILVPLFVCVASVGFVLPNTTVLAMAPHGRIAGSASALLGMVQFGLGAAAGTLVGALNSLAGGRGYGGTAAPLATIIASCACGAWAAYLSRPKAQ